MYIIQKKIGVRIRVSFLFRSIPESISECAEYILVTLRSAVLKFRTNALSVLEYVKRVVLDAFPN